MPNNIVYRASAVAALGRWGDGVLPTTPPSPAALVLTAADTGVVGTPAVASVQNIGGTAGSWVLSSFPAGLTATPSSGTANPGTTTPVSLSFANAATFELSLPGAIGSPQSIVVSESPAPPAVATQLAIAISPTTGATGITTATVTVTPNGTVPGGTASLALSGGGTLGAATLNFPAGSSTAQSTTLTRVSDGTSSVALTNSMSLTNVGTPATYASNTAAVVSNAYRSEQPYLFNTVSATSEPARAPGGAALNLNRVGPMRYYVDGAGWTWVNAGGDWIDSTLTQQGTTSWATMPTTAAGSITTYSASVTTALRHVKQLGGWNAWIVSRAPGGTVRTIAGRFHATTAYRPRIEVTYTDATTATLACRVSAFLGTGSAVPDQTSDTYAMSTSAGTGEIALEFDLPTKPVASAMMFFTVTNDWGGACDLRFNLANPPINTDPVTTGVAADYPLDAGLSGHASIIGQHRYQDGAAIGDFTHSYIDWELSANWDPALVSGGPAADLTKLPHAGVGKWIGLGANTSLISSSYTGENFSALAPGLGALRVYMDKAIPVGDGVENPDNGTAAANAHLHLPFDKFGSLRRMFVRYYSRVGSRHRNPYGTPISDNYNYLKSGLPTWTDMAGKCSITPAHKTKEGGNSGTAGGKYGWTMRIEFGDYYYSTDAPAYGGVNLSLSHTDFQGNNPAGHQYGNGQLPPGYDANKSRSFHGLSQRGGLGSVQYADRWYCHEMEIDLNSVDTSSGTGDGLNWTPDGILRHWIDGRMVYEATNLVMRALPVSTGIAGYQPPVREIGHGTLWFNWYHGGLTVNSIDRVLFVAALAYGEERIGPMAGVYPSWRAA